MIFQSKNLSSLVQKVTDFFFRLVRWNKYQRLFEHKQSLYLIIATLVFYVTSIFSSSNKYIFILAAVYVGFNFLITRSVANLIFSIIPLSLYSVGQEYTFLAVPKDIILSPLYPDGRILNFVFSPYVALLYSAILTAFILVLLRKIKFDKILLSILPVVFLITLSAINTPFFVDFSLLSALNWVGSFSFLLILINHLSNLSPAETEKFWKVIFFQLSLSLIFISAISTVQLIKKNPIGLKIESAKVAPVFGVGADESLLIFRPVGLTPHANILSNVALILFVSLYIVYLKLGKAEQNKLFNLFVVTNLATIFMVIIAQSRTVYFSFVLFFLFFVYLTKDRFKKAYQQIKEIFDKNRVISFLVLSFLLLVIINRIYYSFRIFDVTGGYEVRKQLNQEAGYLIEKYTLLGVGQGMFIPALAMENPSGVISTFAEAVHNGFLLFVAESGLLTQLFLIASIYLVTKIIAAKKLNKLLKLAILIGFIIQLTPMLFQPFINYFSVYTILALGVAYTKKD